MKKIKLDEKKLEWITSKFVEFFEMDDSEYENVKKIVQNALKMKEPPSGSEIETVSTAETFKEAEDNFLHANNETEEKAKRERKERVQKMREE